MYIFFFFSLNDKDYYSVGIRKLSKADCRRVTLDLFHYKNTHDLIYTGISVQMVKSFLAHKKQKADGNKSSYIQLCKYYDAILWGSQQAKQLLPGAFYEEFEKFLTSYRKETVDAKKEGKLDEQEVDPISWSLFKLILSWVLDTSNIFVWTYSILQRNNCMARSVNIGSIGFHNFRASKDHIVCCNDDTKMDKTGKMCTNKPFMLTRWSLLFARSLPLLCFSCSNLYIYPKPKSCFSQMDRLRLHLRDTAVN
jgi:hypothetical protein